MAWAQIARQAKDVPAPESAAPKQIVFAKETDEEENIVFAATAEMQSHPIPEFFKGVLVLDTNAFVKGLDQVMDSADVFITTSSVITECRDKHTKDLLDRCPVRITVLEPGVESIRKVARIAEKTGDLGALSRTDIRLCALALEICAQMGEQKPEIDPRPPLVNEGSSGINMIQNEVTDDDDDESSESAAEDDGESSNDSVDSWGEKKSKKAATAVPGIADDSDDDWITPENVAQVTATLGEVNEANKDTATGNAPGSYEGGFACITGDFPMQNVLLHLGVRTMNSNKTVIQQLRAWLLRCHACGLLVPDTTKQFCPDCGSGNTLKRVSYAVDKDGNKKLFINFKKRINTRGTIYNLPKPRGGRRGTNKTVALRADQLSMRKKVERKALDDTDELDGFGGAQGGRFDPHQLRNSSSYKRYNVNERKKVRASRKK